MKSFFTLCFLCITFSSFAQYECETFEKSNDTFLTQQVFIDTVNYHSNKWQIGIPNKLVFDTNESVIVTDTMNAYPPNDTSIFYVKLAMSDINLRWSNWLQVLDINQYLDVDTGDVALMDISADSGKSWRNIDSTTQSSKGWEKRSFFFGPDHNPGFDTFLFRFTFISDSNTKPRAGWMLASMCPLYGGEGIAIINNDELFSVYPNPATDKLHIKTENSTLRNKTITVWRIDGSCVYNNPQFTGTSIDVSPLANGIYIVKYTDDTQFSVKRFIIDR